MSSENILKLLEECNINIHRLRELIKKAQELNEDKNNNKTQEEREKIYRDLLELKDHIQK
jgi:hypothetical protein